ncbi:MAG: DNA repair protein RecN [Peptococcaceae bacterium]|jgi:DNA repair protein RecN (Recombination protein N)|nr:DNA repair protein RecN [Peptococcaceae bacterium]
MLAELLIENFALMENVRLSLRRGLSVFTGETGAGKSRLADALGILLGGRAESDLIRFGEERARIEGVFTELGAELALRLEGAGYPAEDGQWILFRELNQNGKNICRIQGRAVPLSLYRQLCAGWVDIHGQMEHQSLLNPALHRCLLDALGGVEQLGQADEVRALALAWRALGKQERQLVEEVQERRQRLENIQGQIAEIDEIHPELGEEERWQQEKKRLGNAEKISRLSEEVYRTLYLGDDYARSALDTLSVVRKGLNDLVRLDEHSAALAELSGNVYFAAEELVGELKTYCDQLCFEPERLNWLEERLHQLQRLRKYGASLAEVLAVRESLELESDELRHLERDLERLKQEQADTLRQYDRAAEQLSSLREACAQAFQEDVAGELADLSLEKGRLLVQMHKHDEPSPEGRETIEFYFSANPGEPLKPLAKVASGGEMSRLVLALKSLLARVESVDAFVFDEVDSGVGGRILQKVGEKLAGIAMDRQVFCITHAAYVAAYADEHFAIIKESEGERTRTQVVRLDEEARVRELGRMLGGDQDGMAQTHARELWKSLRQTKQNTQQ